MTVLSSTIMFFYFDIDIHIIRRRLLLVLVSRVFSPRLINYIIPQLAPYKSALPLDVKPKCSLLVGPASLVS